MQRSIIAPAERVTNLRWTMAVLVGFGILVASFDQVSLSVSGAALSEQFGLNDVGLGLLLSTFGWAYAIASIPLGLVLDRIGAAKMGRAWSLAWGLVSLLTAFASSFGLLIGARAALGIAQAPALPTAAKATGLWFPVNERSLGTATFDAAGKLAIAIGIPLLMFITVWHGWHATFLFTGVCALVYFIANLLWYHDPAEHTGLTYAEQQYLANGGAQGAGLPAGVNVFASAKTWGLTIGYFAYAFAFLLFVTWLPAYFARAFHVGGFTSALSAALPWLVAAIADIVIGGALVDRLVRGSANPSATRKTILIIGMLLGLAVFGAALTHDQTTALVYISIAIVGLGISAPVAWSIPSLIAPRGGTGTIAALMNGAGALGGIAAPIAAGFLLQATGNFEDVFIAAAIVLVIGILSYLFVLGRIEPIDASGGGLTI